MLGDNNREGNDVGWRSNDAPSLPLLCQEKEDTVYCISSSTSLRRYLIFTLLQLRHATATYQVPTLLVILLPVRHRQ